MSTKFLLLLFLDVFIFFFQLNLSSCQWQNDVKSHDGCGATAAATAIHYVISTHTHTHKNGSHCVYKERFRSGMKSFSTWMVVNRKLQLINFSMLMYSIISTKNVMASRALMNYIRLVEVSIILTLKGIEFMMWITKSSVHCRKFQ